MVVEDSERGDGDDDGEYWECFCPDTPGGPYGREGTVRAPGHEGAGIGGGCCNEGAGLGGLAERVMAGDPRDIVNFGATKEKEERLGV